MEPSIFFILCLSCFLNHEIDAVRRREWRILPFLSRIDDDGLGCVIFTALHLPLFAAVIWACFAAPEDTRLYARMGLDAFATIHLGLHILLRNNPRMEPHEPKSPHCHDPLQPRIGRVPERYAVWPDRLLPLLR
jgi:hypothetical protein